MATAPPKITFNNNTPQIYFNKTINTTAAGVSKPAKMELTLRVQYPNPRKDIGSIVNRFYKIKIKAVPNNDLENDIKIWFNSFYLDLLFRHPTLISAEVYHLIVRSWLAVLTTKYNDSSYNDGCRFISIYRGRDLQATLHITNTRYTKIQELFFTYAPPIFLRQYYVWDIEYNNKKLDKVLNEFNPYISQKKKLENINEIITALITAINTLCSIKD